MKKIFYLLIVIPFLSIGQEWNPLLNFSEPIIICDNADLGLTRPRIVVDSYGNPIVMWTSIDDKKIYISKYNQTDFGNPILVSPENFTFNGNQNYGPEISNNGDFIFITLYNIVNEINNVYIIYSTDGGVAFSDPIKIAEEETLIEGAGVHVTANNTPIVTYENLPDFGEANHIICFGEFIDSDPGITFNNTVIANAQTEGIPCECCLGHLTSNNDALIFMYRNNINNQRNMFATSFDDKTMMFDEGFSIDTYSQSLSVCPTEGPKGLILEDFLITTFKSYAYSPAKVSITISSISNQEILEESLVDWGQGYGTQSLPEIAANDSIIAVVWKEFRYYNFDSFISFKSSPLVDNEVDFGESVSISSSEPNSPTAPDFISVDIASYGDEFHVTYLDYNNDILYYRKITPNNEITKIEESKATKMLLKSVDILGREIIRKGFSIKIYDDGSVDKKYLLR